MGNPAACPIPDIQCNKTGRVNPLRTGFHCNLAGIEWPEYCSHFAIPLQPRCNLIRTGPDATT